MYKVVFKKSALKDLEGVGSIYIDSVTDSIKKLSYNPRPHGSKKLSTCENSYRIRVGVYRVIYSIKDNVLVVEVIKINHRRDVYR